MSNTVIKKYCLILLLVFTVVCAYANEADLYNTGNNKNGTGRFDINAGFTFANNPRLLGGHFEFGFIPFKNVFYFENRIGFRAGGAKIEDINTTVFMLTDKLVFGRKAFERSTGMYIYLEGGIGTYGNEEKKFFSDLTYSFGFGGGFELGDVEFGAMYIEAGYLGHKIIDNFPTSGLIIQTGWRIYF